ncbi:TNF receptor-associated factor 5-like [Acropora millepora]|uniref:TNF receptor-associated factor 5-like n=1 Tax=Acropora millepora TaxID=45264 RepID=UPI001CF4CFA1|nr:TNF receptor-associated factor 5-like [Acropora millepora]
MTENASLNCAFDGNVDSGLLCNICYCQMLKPVMLRCGHLKDDCQVSIQELLNNSNAHSRCPLCRADFERQDSRPNVALAKLTSELQVHCQSLDCGWSGKYGNVALHYQSCPKVPMPCQHDECGYVAVRERITSHSDSCPKRNLPCPECQHEVKFENLQEHKKKWCANALIKYPLSCSGEELPRSHINLHLHHCPEKGLECQIPGCRRIVKRKEMKKHLIASAMSHLKMQSAEIQRLRREIHEKEREKSTRKLEEKSAVSFDWKVEQCRELTRPIASDTSSTGESTWRCLITEKNNLLFQLVSSRDPQTVQIRKEVIPCNLCLFCKSIYIFRGVHFK